MLKKIASIAAAAIVLAGGAFAASFLVSEAVAAQEPQAETMSLAEMQAAIEELRAMIQLLLNQSNPAAAPAVPSAPVQAQQATATGGYDATNRAIKPANPPITRQQAIDLALAHTGGGRVDEASIDWERRQWVWEVEVEFDNGRDVDVYIDIHTGEVLWTD